MKELWAGYFRDSSGPWAPGLQKRVMPCAVSKGIKPSGPGTHVKTKKQHNVEGLRQRMGGAESSVNPWRGAPLASDGVPAPWATGQLVPLGESGWTSENWKGTQERLSLTLSLLSLH